MRINNFVQKILKGKLGLNLQPDLHSIVNVLFCHIMQPYINIDVA